jgi:peroxiredoxin
LSSGGNIFKINQIKSKVVIIEIFSMYCPYCQAEATNINNLNQLIENNPAYKDKIKIIGIGAGNTPFEVGTFKRKYTIAFPLVPDGDFKLHKLLMSSFPSCRRPGRRFVPISGRATTLFRISLGEGAFYNR